MKRSIIIPIVCYLSLVVIVNGCKTSGLPQWIRQHPVHPDYYIGVGIARKIAGQTDHAARARENALNEIASNIAVNIMSESNLMIIQEAGVLRETFIANITSNTKAVLEGYELVDVWENDKEYRAFYRLSKRKHSENVSRRLMLVAGRAGRLFDEGFRAENSGSYTIALGYYLQAACEVATHWGLGLPMPDGLPGEFLDTEIFLRLRLMLSQMSIEIDPVKTSVGFLETPEIQAKIKTAYKKGSVGSLTFSGLPLITEILEGKIKCMPLQPTNLNGESDLEFGRAMSAGTIRISVFPDIKVLCGCDEKCFSQTIFHVLPVPKGYISILVPSVAVVFQTNEVNMGINNSHPVSSALIGQALTNSGWRIVNAAGSSDYTIRINVSAKPGTERMGVHTAFAEGTFTLIHSRSGEEFFTITKSQVAGGGRNYESAGRQALEKITEWFVSEFEKNFFK